MNNLLELVGVMGFTFTIAWIVGLFSMWLWTSSVNRGSIKQYRSHL